MKLIRLATSETVPLEDGFLWSDEFSWKAIEQTQNYAIDGSLVIQEGKKKSGRPITLQPADREMGWIKLRELRTVLEWSKVQNEVFHWHALGYPSLQAFINAMYKDEASQLDAMCRYIKVNNLVNALKNKDWKYFAHGYNGAAYAKNSYDVKLGNAYKKWSK